MEPSFYAIIPADVRYDERLKPNAKLLYGEITALAQREGFCWAGNEYFANLYKVSNETISRWVSQLCAYGYIDVEIFKNDGNKRRIAIDKKVKTYCQKDQEVLTKKSIAIDKKVNSNIRIINTSNNTINRERKALAFLQENAPMLFEDWQMKFKSKIHDFTKFSELFNCKYDEEDLEYSSKKINARLTRFAINYIERQDPQKQLTPETTPAYRKLKF
ncbi:helix-turn-helix domain-containing protein [Flavobacterium sp. NKUCC04_CG]|uniref:helix-turn-helix domain-containing protein n=1 Tax=Flavobacterium sp. NKUCC04_CG TaxID=2842121 RepID=UPI001C5AEF6A|nr:helix-turn-helix domain-containing protein [Flavobacterium sp. NKUCC04_CG]MBW3518325.1 helix-turn-helix domain-containing protein [Flavobacterium sp. NKUCC04_CG]